MTTETDGVAADIKRSAEFAGSGKAADAPKNAQGLRTDGPTLDEYVKAGYNPDTYPPAGYEDKRSAAERARGRATAIEGPSPRVGMTVLYTGEITNGISYVHPAIITRVHNDDVVNLHVFFDGAPSASRSTVQRVRSDARVEPPSSSRWDWRERD